MKRVKVLLSSLALSVVLTGAALADQIGVIDVNEMSQKYSKAVTYNTEAKNREEELVKLKLSLREQLKAGEKLSPVEKKNLEDKLNAQYLEKFKAYKDWGLEQEKMLKESFDKAIMSVAQSQKLDVILPKQSVIQGGKDVTADVLNALNK